ncbi:MAG TPA: DUF2500 family protein [Candidatus Faecousia intestinavium]|nr:DUF2500 family protein [Candidatus Faecousia intestinavium]
MPQVCLNCQFVSNLAKACANLKKSRKPQESASGRGQVLARRMERRQELLEPGASLWRFWVKFQLEDGSQRELQVSEEAYGALRDGESFRLTWQGESLQEYLPE